MRNKIFLTEELLSYLPKEEKIPIEQAMLTWWFNLRENGGLRLTHTGYRALKSSIKLETYRFDLNQPRSVKNKKLILALDRKLKWPYYMEKSWIDFFSSKEAMLAKLYPDLENFLKLYN
jgi:hypothetical protein